jgi:hypothetical protein
MRTTIRLDDELLKAAKMRAAEQGITLTQLIDESLRERLTRRGGKAEQSRSLQLPAYGEGGVRGGVDLSDNRALRDLMDDVPSGGGGTEAGRRAT